ncbi:aminotransferase-like protein 8 [Elsinoe australis]|uniref:Aminotransferase-like protein 8 n=1 Tax=Elsinoe australis TaxID=40998 RepID=A0A4V6DT32_9PEZI|nr:aminotransferase-like protein 8 [Elsinoe australis]
MLSQIKAIEESRNAAPPLPTGPAAFVKSSTFRVDHRTDKPAAKDWSTHLSSEASDLKPAVLKAASQHTGPSDPIALGTARPASIFYPWDSIDIIGGGSRWDQTEDDSTTSQSMHCKRDDPIYDLGVALNYGTALGSPPLLRFLTEHVELIHDPPYQDWETCLTAGTTAALDTMLRVLCSRGDWILAERFTYPGTLAGARSRGINVCPLDMDDEGLLPAHMKHTLQTWDLSESPRPSVLYTIPTGQNPTGTTQSNERRQAIYRIAEEYNLMILEDDPYYFIDLDQTDAGPSVNGLRDTSLQNYLARLPKSYLSMDTTGRVVRFDATSKILAPGLRCGWMTASTQIIEKYVAYTELSTIHPSGPSQLMLYKLLDEIWGHVGFLEWLERLSAGYHHRHQYLSDACRQHLPKDMCSWETPKRGMFIWIRIRSGQVDAKPEEAPVIEDRIFASAMSRGVTVAKGSWFRAGDLPASEVQFRMTFVAATDAQMVEGVKAFGGAVKDEFKLAD